jgi:hypothetical protein
MDDIVGLIAFGLGCFLCGFSLGGRADRWLCHYKDGHYRPRYGRGYQGLSLRKAPTNPPSGGSSVQPMTGGYVVKGGRNEGPSQIKKRPAPPAAIPTGKRDE